MWHEPKDLILLIAGFLLSIVGALIGARLQRMISERGELQPLKQLLNFSNPDVLFVFPHREEIREAILPRTSTEDFLAMNNFISALLKIGANHTVGVRNTLRCTEDDKKRNLVLICSPRSNSVSTAFQKELAERNLGVFTFREISGEPCHIVDPQDPTGKYASASWQQEAAYLRDGVAPSDLHSKTFTDYAVITKVANPWNPSTKVVLLAGIRGIGTWGAAECIKKHWRDIHVLLPHGKKDADFSALLRIEYDNCDITNTKVLKVIPVEKR